MVRAILEDRKTQTRRILKNQPVDIRRVFMKSEGLAYVENAHGVEIPLEVCKFGKPDDLLWVKEKCCYLDVMKSALSNFQGDGIDRWIVQVEYEDGKEHEVIVDGDRPKATRQRGEIGWRSSIHMHRWASRINLEITGVRVERLQDISEADAIAEGAQRFEALPAIHPYGQDPRWSMEIPISTDECLGSARMAFANFFMKVNGEGLWDANPWVWVIEFKRIKP